MFQEVLKTQEKHTAMFDCVTGCVQPWCSMSCPRLQLQRHAAINDFWGQGSGRLGIEIILSNPV